MKAADIDERDVLMSINRHEKFIGAPIVLLQGDFPAVPWKVLRAKLKSLIRRRLVLGCCCGCRGDFTLTAQGVARLEYLLDALAGQDTAPPV